MRGPVQSLDVHRPSERADMFKEKHPRPQIQEMHQELGPNPQGLQVSPQ